MDIWPKHIDFVCFGNGGPLSNLLTFLLNNFFLLNDCKTKPESEKI